MATDTLTKTGQQIPGATWETFVRSKPHDNRVYQAALAHNYPVFASLIKTIDPGAKTFELWNDVQAMHREEELDHPEKPEEHEQETHEETHKQATGQEHMESLITMFKKPKFMEEDPEFWKLVESHKKKWEEENPAPDRNATDAEKQAYDQNSVDFTFGSLDDPESQSLEQKAAAEFELQHKKSSKPKDVEKLKQYIVYRNTPTTFDKDKEIHHVQTRIAWEGNARRELLVKKGLKGTDLDQSYEAILARLKEKRWAEFVEKHPEKAEAYASKPYISKNKDDQAEFAEFQKAHTVVKEKQETVAAAEAIASEEKETTVETAQEISGEHKKEIPEALPDNKTPSASAIPHRDAQQQPTPQKPVSQPPKNAATNPPPPQAITKTPNTQRSSQNKKRLIAFLKSFFKNDQQSTSIASDTPFESQVNQNTDRISFGSNVVSQGISTAQNAQGTWDTGKRIYDVFKASRFFSGAGGVGAGGVATGGAAVGGTAVAGGGAVAGGAAATGAAASSPIWVPIALIVGGILLLILIVFFMVYYLYSSVAQKPTTTETTIPGLTLTLTGPTQVPNPSTDSTGANIQYTINATYTGTADVTLSDALPTNTTFVSATGNFTNTDTVVSWRLNDNTSTTPSPKTYTFTIVLHPQSDDILVKNKIVANATGGSGGFLSGGSGNACTAQYEGTGYCSVENLKQYFAGDASKALVASMICALEGVNNPNAINSNCGTNDYSIGLFQVNLVAHCPGAYGGNSCHNLLDVGKRNACEVQYKNPEENIKFMVNLSQNGTKWTDWGAFGAVRTRLSACGIN